MLRIIISIRFWFSYLKIINLIFKEAEMKNNEFTINIRCYYEIFHNNSSNNILRLIASTK